MNPADGAFFGLAAEVPAAPLPDLAIILPGGRTLLALSNLADLLPRQGSCGDASWQAVCWPVQNGRAGLALVRAPLVGTHWLRTSGGEEREIGAPRALDVAPAPLAEFVRRHGLNSREVFDFLAANLTHDAPAGTTRSGDGDFAARFLSLAAEAGGFVEILGCPGTRGLFAQGWAMSLGAGRHRLARLDGALALCDADVALFARGDIPPPGMGFCLFSLDWETDLEGLDCLFYEQDGTLERLEVVRGSVLRLAGDAATDHVRHMLPRLAGDEGDRHLSPHLPPPVSGGGHAVPDHAARRRRLRFGVPGALGRASGDGLAAGSAAAGRARDRQEHGWPLRAPAGLLESPAARGPEPGLCGRSAFFPAARSGRYPAWFRRLCHRQPPPRG